ncbi:MAG: CAP domain-containing protein [Candidatus Spechtbacterales bacterium]
MEKKHKILWSVIGAAAVILFLLQQFSPASEQIKDFERRIGDFFINSLNEKIITPEPLRGPLGQNSSSLTRSGIIEWTNRQRIGEGLPPFAESEKLSAAAALKAQDMLDRQYFAHEAPTGEGVGDLAKVVGYEYIVIGENLALGNFINDEALVQAWMDSPGHRENIVKSSYTQIGVGLSRGEFEGNEVWVAVQHFGRPRSECPEPDENILSKINANKERMKELESEIEKKRQELDAMNPKRGPLYNAKVREYNELVEEYNGLVNETKELSDQYNLQVREFNECASG